MDAPAILLETPRLQLREVALADAAFVLALLNDPSWLENIGDRGVRSEADAERYISDTLRGPYRRLGYGLYAVQRRSADGPIGICGLVKREFLPAPDLGFALLPGFVGQGYASEAARAVIAYAHGTLGIEQLYAIVQHDNQRSVRLLERLGFRRYEPAAAPAGLEAGIELHQLRA
jgi:RimJ/RimL family protein N-acetyltransferase